jgi:predicted PurR-regulated permease PerM
LLPRWPHNVEAIRLYRRCIGSVDSVPRLIWWARAIALTWRTGYQRDSACATQAPPQRCDYERPAFCARNPTAKFGDFVSEPPPYPPLRPRSRRVVFVTLIVLLLGVLALVLLVFWPFVITLALATAMALLLKPLHNRLTRYMGGRPGIPALLLVLALGVIILVPVMGMLAAIAAQALTFYDWLEPQLTSQTLDRWWSEQVLIRFPWVAQVQTMGDGQVMDFLTTSAAQLAGAANDLLQGSITGLTAAALELVLLLIMLFFFLRDGEHFREQIRRVSPLTREQGNQVLDQIAKTMQGALLSLLFVPVLQGALATVGYLIIGLPNALLWGGITTLVAFVPAIGTPLVWVPICVYLLIQGQIWQCVALAVYGTLVVTSIDNIVRPLFLKGTARIHPLWSFLAILGGLMTFGALGLLVGPLILSLGVSALRIFEMDVLRGQPVPAPVVPVASTDAVAEVREKLKQ